MNLIFEHGIWSFANAEIWVGIGLIIFFGILIAAGVPKMAGKALDAKAVKIQADLDEAARLRAEAEALLAQIRKEKAEAVVAGEHRVFMDQEVVRQQQRLLDRPKRRPCRDHDDRRPHRGAGARRGRRDRSAGQCR